MRHEGTRCDSSLVLMVTTNAETNRMKTLINATLNDAHPGLGLQEQRLGACHVEPVLG